jgi:hypothetical protein
MRLRIAFKLNGDDADLARQIEHAAGIPIDKIAKVAMVRYMDEVINRAKQMKDEQDGRQPSTSPPLDSDGTVSSPSDAVSCATV